MNIGRLVGVCVLAVGCLAAEAAAARPAPPKRGSSAARLTYAINALTYHKLLLRLLELTGQLHR